MARTPHPLCLLRAFIALEALEHLMEQPHDGPKPDLRTPCSPEGRSPIGKHKHLCDCGTIWEHDDALPLLCSESENREAHTCPDCGREQWFKHLPSIF